MSKNQPKMTDLPDILSPRMISAYLGIGYVKALAMVKSGAVPCIKIGNAYKVPKELFRAWLNEPGFRKVL
ncbi:MAG: hypothetical protein A4E55_02377 [Pelotomaculum sp. PtaU1.Bin035]|nr:MAG: hypothetical protein A4E55_02377 [Pelotomaculum sp. PtaU1.Bin035]